ncbi:hypothetical protein AGMMS49975_13930 [Clostridia bacterium]|nr:hypothetical protein AGMMS49975_13930 [Clostridia bacterium]
MYNTSEGDFNIYSVSNNINTLIAMVTDTDKYDYQLTGNEPATLDFIVSKELSSGDILYSNVVRMTSSDGTYETEFLDTDNDGLYDIFEHLLGTDINNPDTDNDGLTDYQEANITDTNPLLADTDGNGVSDADEDLDGDGIVDGDCMVGIAPELSYNGGKFESAVLKFKIKDAFFPNELNEFPCEVELQGIKRINIFKYFDDINMLLPIETKFDLANNIVYADIDELATYCLVDMEKWFVSFLEPAWQMTQPAPAPASRTRSLPSNVGGYGPSSETSETVPTDTTGDTEENNGIDEIYTQKLVAVSNFALASEQSVTYAPADIVFVLQSAGVSKSDFDIQKQLINPTSAEVFGKMTDARIMVIEFRESTGGIVKTSDDKSWAKSASEISDMLSRITYTNYSGYANRGIAFSAFLTSAQMRPNAVKFIYSAVSGSGYDATGYTHMDVCNQKQLIYSEIFPSGWDYTNAAYKSQISAAIASTGGISIYYTSAPTQTVINHIFSKVPKIENEDEVADSSKFTIIPALKEIELKQPLKQNGQTDSDGDGLSDWEETDGAEVTKTKLKAVRH